MADKEKIKTEDEIEELKRQVENYYTLGITQSARGQVILVFGSLYILSIILSFFDIVSLSDLMWSLIIYIPILIFVYKGHKWAMITLMILWVIEKVYTAYLTVENQSGSVWGSIFWLIIGISVIVKALKVENTRQKIIPSAVTAPTTIGNYCKECGTKLSNDSKYCANCGTPQ
ncbi:MAG: zinc ribbon domain-containing protein [Minisyncoccia bacterium]